MLLFVAYSSIETSPPEVGRKTTYFKSVGSGPETLPSANCTCIGPAFGLVIEKTSTGSAPVLFENPPVMKFPAMSKTATFMFVAAPVPPLTEKNGSDHWKEKLVVPGGTQRNHASLAPDVDWRALTLPEQLVLADAQTSGGLLIATRAPDALEAALGARSVHVQRIGVTTEGPPGRIRVFGRVRQR